MIRRFFLEWLADRLLWLSSAAHSLSVKCKDAALSLLVRRLGRKTR